MSEEQPAAPHDDAGAVSDSRVAKSGSAANSAADEGAVHTGQGGDYLVLADALLARLADGRRPEEAALALAVLLNRAGTRLHNLTRGEASARKEQPEWPAWAQLQNAARNIVLQASTCRDLAARLAGRRQ